LRSFEAQLVDKRKKNISWQRATKASYFKDIEFLQTSSQERDRSLQKLPFKFKTQFTFW